MGTDIRAIIEYADVSETPNIDLSDPSIGFYSFAEIDIGRNYNLFGFLAGVRGADEAIVPIRGLPENPSFLTQERAFAKLLDDDEMSKISPCDVLDIYDARLFKKSSFPSDYKFQYIKDNIIVMPDTYNHSWLLLPELKIARLKTLSEDLRYDREDVMPILYGIDSIIASMEALEQFSGYKTRLVFWFD